MRLSRAISSLLALPILIAMGMPIWSANMLKSDESRPEPILFLLAADDAMKEHFRKNGEYPREWQQLDISFASGPYRTTDANVRPGPQQGNAWRPRNCEYTYVIIGATMSDYLIQARNNSGEIAYEMRPGLEEPRKIAVASEDELCNLEQQIHKEIPEAARFLNAAASALKRYRQQYGEYPKGWDQLDFHWAMVPHKATDQDARPPKNGSTLWQPRGSSYSYRILRSGKDSYLLRSENNEGLLDYQIGSEDVSPNVVR